MKERDGKVQKEEEEETVLLSHLSEKGYFVYFQLIA